MNLKKVMAVNLRRIRHDRNMTLEGLADRTGLSARNIGAIERADVSASIVVLGHIADTLKVEVGELVKASDRAR